MWMFLGLGGAISGAVAWICARADAERADAIMTRERRRIDVGLNAYERASRERALLAALGLDRNRLNASQREAEARIQNLLDSAKSRARHLED